MWQQVYTISKTQVSKTFAINQEFTNLELIVEAKSGSANTTWIRAGYLQPIFLVPDIGQVKGKRIGLIMGTQNIVIPILESPYYLEYHFLKWFLDINLTIWEDSTFLAGNENQATSENTNTLRRIESKIDAIEAYGNQ